MKESKRAHLFCTVSGVCFAFYVIWEMRDAFLDTSYTITWFDILWWLIYISLAGMFFMGRKTVGIPASIGAATFFEAIDFIERHRPDAAAFTLIFLMMLTAFLLDATPNMKPYYKVKKIFCLLPFAVYVVYDLVAGVGQASAFSMVSGSKGQLMNILMDIVIGMTILFPGLWLRQTIIDEELAEQHN